METEQQTQEPDTAEIQEELLQTELLGTQEITQETPQPGPEPPDPRLNTFIPQMIAQVVWKSPPTAALPKGTEPTEASNAAQQYMNFTTPVLTLLEFHTLLNTGQLSPTTRLIIGGVVLVGGVLMMKPPKLGKKKETKHHDEAPIATDKPGRKEPRS